MRNEIMETKEKIEIMQASLDGETIEISLADINKWSETKFPLWDWANYEYRIKREPRRLWVNMYDNNQNLGYKSKCDAERYVENPSTNKVVEFIEVIHED